MHISPSTKSASLMVVRVEQDGNLPCFIAGSIIKKENGQTKSAKDVNGYGVFHTHNDADIHLAPCDKCPVDEDIISVLPSEDTKFDRYQHELSKAL